MQIKIVTRKSRLALRQTTIVKDLLLKHHYDLQIEVIPISTEGDELIDQSLISLGGKGLFVKELEQYLLNGKADIAVHSLKDMPAILPEGLALGAILPRADPRDVFVSDKFSDINELPRGAKVGTSSLRRQAQVLALRPDLTVLPLRGNVETRINKLLAQEYDAIILAAAGLTRLTMTEYLRTPLTVTQMLPAVGQGALAIEYRQDRPEIARIIALLHDPHTAVCVRAERAMNTVLDGGCQAPIAGLAEISGEKLCLTGLVASVDGTTILRMQENGSINDPERLGINVANALMQQGAQQLIIAAKKLWT